MRSVPVGTKVELPKQPNIKKSLGDEEVFFSHKEGKRIDVFELNKTHPEDIYTHNFASKVSRSLFQGKRVIINCGEYTGERKTKDEFHPLKLPQKLSQIELVVSELIYGEPAETIRHIDDKSSDKNRKIHSSIRYETLNTGFFGFFKQLARHEPPEFLFVELEENRIIGGMQAYDYLEQLSNYSDY